MDILAEDDGKSPIDLLYQGLQLEKKRCECSSTWVHQDGLYESQETELSSIIVDCQGSL